MEKWSDEYITIKASEDAAKKTKAFTMSDLYPYGSREVPLDPAEEQLIGEDVARNPGKGAKPFCQVCYHHHHEWDSHLD